MNDSISQEKDQRFTVVALAVAMMLASLGTSIANVALPSLAVEFSASLKHVQWVVTAYLIALTVSVVLVGHLGDRFGLKQMLVWGLGLFTVASLLCAVAPTLWFLIGARALQGGAGAFLMTLTLAMVHETTGKDRIGRTMGLLGTMSAFGTALGPSLGGVLISTAGWPGVFLILVPIGVLGVVLACAALPQSDRNTVPAKIHLVGLRQTRLVPRMIANFLVAAVMMATLVIGPFYLGIALGLSVVAVGFVMSVGPVISVCSGIPSGRLVDRFGPDRIAFVGLAALALGSAALAVLPGLFGIAGYLAAIAILTPGYQLFQAANNTAVMAGVSKDQRGIFSGLLGLSRNLGLVLGALGLGWVFAYGTTTATLNPAAVTGGMQLTFTVAGGMMILAMGFVRAGRNLDR